MKSETDGLVTAHEIDNKKFNITRMRAGYDLDDVDDFLDRVAYTVRCYENKFIPRLTPASKDSLRLTMTDDKGEESNFRIGVHEALALRTALDAFLQARGEKVPK